MSFRIESAPARGWGEGRPKIDFCSRQPRAGGQGHSPAGGGIKQEGKSGALEEEHWVGGARALALPSPHALCPAALAWEARASRPLCPHCSELPSRRCPLHRCGHWAHTRAHEGPGQGCRPACSQGPSQGRAQSRRLH